MGTILINSGGGGLDYVRALSTNSVDMRMSAYGTGSVGQIGTQSNHPVQLLANNTLALTATGANLQAAGTLGVTGDITASSGVVNLGAGNGFVQTATNGVAEIAFNYVGYAGGTTQFRNFGVYDGKNAPIFSIVGSTKAASLTGTLAVSGTITSTVGNNSTIIRSASTTTGYSALISADSTGASTRLLMEGSVGGVVMTGSTAYATIIGSTNATPLQLGTNNNVRLTIDSAGAVTIPGTLGVTGAITGLNATAIPAGGTTGSGILVSSTANFGVFFGSGAPTLSAAKGSLYLRSDGSTTNDRMYVNTNGTTTWTAVTTVA